MNSKSSVFRLSILLISTAFSGCGSPKSETAPVAPAAACPQVDDTSEIQQLKIKVAFLEKENSELRQTPPVLLETIRTALASSLPDQAQTALEELVKRFPEAKEAKIAKQEIAAYAEKILKAQQEVERRRLLGFKALGTKNQFQAEDVRLSVESAGVLGTWRFDDHGYQYSYREAPRGEKFIVLKLSLSTPPNQKSPLFAYSDPISPPVMMETVHL